MVDFTSLTVVLLAVLVVLVSAVITLFRWAWRWLRHRRQSRLGGEVRKPVAGCRVPSANQRLRERLVVGMGVVVVCAVGWGFVEPGWLETTETQVISPKLRPGSRIRVVHLSDFHLEADSHLADEVVRRVARIKPDIILFTGDAINEAAGLRAFRSTMAALARIAPTFGVRGNWETWWFPNLNLYGGTGAAALDGRATAITIRGESIWLVGVGVDREQRLSSAMSVVHKGQFSVLLHHFPALAPQAAARGVDLMLAGDTHGGQSWLPLVGEVVRITRRGFWRSRGMHREGRLRLYVNRGIGNEGGIPRFRFLCRPEIAVIELRGAGRAP